MDNAKFHRKKQLFKISEKFEMNLIFLPSYSPELNPIEKFWAYLKSYIKNNIHLFPSLDDAIFSFFQLYLRFLIFHMIFHKRELAILLVN